MADYRTIDAAYAGFAEAPLLRRVHGPAYLNVGWHPAADPAAALVDRLLDFVDGPPATVLDVACGRAASTARIAARWPDSTVIGLDRNPALLPAAPPAGVRLIRADATALPVLDATVDLVCCIEAALHFPPRRAFFAEAARALRPGGRLVLTDLLVDPAVAGWAALVPAGNTERSEAEYASALRACGLAVRWMRDITAYTWRPYAAALVAAAGAESTYAAATVDRMLGERPVGAYLEVVAEVPA